MYLSFYLGVKSFGGFPTLIEMREDGQNYGMVRVVSLARVTVKRKRYVYMII